MRDKGKRLDKYVKDYVVFDLETTGINQNLDVIIEISALRVKGGGIERTYSTLVNPGRHIPAGATAINGITDEMVKDAPDIGEAIAGFLEFIGGSILVGHNIHTFDMNFAYDAAWLALGKKLDNDYIDTLYMARNCLPKLSHHRLTDISEYFHIDTQGAHRALNDCIMNQKCYEALGKIWKEKEDGKVRLRNANSKLKQHPAVQYPECFQAAEQAGGIPPCPGTGRADAELKKGGLVCPRCGGRLCLRKGRYGTFYGCGNFPACRYTRDS